MLLFGFFIILTVTCSQNKNQAANSKRNSEQQIPHLSKQGATTQFISDGHPMLILGGELGNSSFTSLEYMEPIWPKLKMMNLNTVLAPIYRFLK